MIFPPESSGVHGRRKKQRLGAFEVIRPMCPISSTGLTFGWTQTFEYSLLRIGALFKCFRKGTAHSMGSSSQLRLRLAHPQI